jgi:DNA-binding CsgD family transcriptional regulator
LAPLDLLIRVRCARGEVGQAEGELKKLEAISAVVRTPFLLALVSHGRGQVAFAAGDAVTAKAQLEDALDLFIGARLPFEAALVRLDLGRALHASGRPDPALDLYRTAHEAFRSLGAMAQAARAQDVAEELVRMDRRMSGVGGLSPREKEVLMLLTRGLSNEEIAVELVLSKHTVRRHVSNILTKLDAPSRTAAAVWALAHQRA